MSNNYYDINILICSNDCHQLIIHSKSATLVCELRIFKNKSYCRNLCAMLRSKFVSLFILLFIILINSINSFSQSGINSFIYKHENQVRFTSTIPISGISFNSIAEDSLGFYWIGTNNGLARYDGKGFKFFSSLLSDSGKILIYQCKVFKDATGRIWINSNNKLYYFNLHCFRLKYFPNPVLIKWSINALVSTDQFIWIANNLPP